MSQEQLIYKLIPKVMSEVGFVEKAGYNDRQKYKFRKMDDIYLAIQKPLSDNGIFFIPETLERIDSESKTGSGGTMYFVKLKVKYKICASDGSFVEAIVWGEGSDTLDKASNKALTGAFKYMIIQVFAIPTEDLHDPDYDSAEIVKQKTPQNQSPKPIENHAPISSSGIAKKDLDQLISIAKARHWKNDQVTLFIEKLYSKKSSKELTKDEMTGLCDIINENTFKSAFDGYLKEGSGI